MGGVMKRFIVNETFTDEDTGTEYAQGAIYEVDATAPADVVEQWVADGKVRDPDEDIEKSIDEAKAGHEDEDEDDKDEPA